MFNFPFPSGHNQMIQAVQAVGGGISAKFSFIKFVWLFCEIKCLHRQNIAPKTKQNDVEKVIYIHYELFNPDLDIF